MIFDEIVLDNFGVYSGRQVLELAPPSPDKPIVLIGGFNGEGKTTLLDAIQLALYGKLARCSNRGSLAYDEYLRRSVHHAAIEKRAGVEVQFRHTTNGEEHTLRVSRSWSANGKGVKEQLKIERDGETNQMLTDHWEERVDAFIPLQVSHLFFFDGDKIQDLANLENSSRLLSTAIQSLLGLDVVDRLKADLVVLERKKRTELKNDAERQQIKETEDELEQLEEFRDKMVTQGGAAQNDLDQGEKRLREIERRYRKEGGELFEQREQLEAEQTAEQGRLQDLEAELREIAAGPAPLLLLEKPLVVVEEQDRREEEAERAKTLSSILSKRDSLVLSKLRSQRVSKKACDGVKLFMAKDRKRLTSAASATCYLRLDAETRDALKDLCGNVVPSLRQRMTDMCDGVDNSGSKLLDLDRKLAAVPSQDTLAGLVEERRVAKSAVEKAKVRVSVLNAELERARRACDSKQAHLVREIEKAVDGDFEQDAVSRLLRHSMRVRSTLDKFHLALVKRNVRRIEQLVLESYRRLLHKKRLVSDLKIDPETYALELHAADGRVLSPDRLSAGERQLLALSVLWALARASGRPLPTVIDTPLGRLDSSHRAHLVERYFPYASHQVLLLSTDREIDRPFYKYLKQWIGHEYHLEHNDDTGGTIIKTGYFW